MEPAAIKALAKAQKEMGKAIKNAKNPHLKSAYADLGAVMDACFDALHSNGFAVYQPGGADEFGSYVETVFAHESGHEFRSKCYLVIGKQDMQGVGSAWTYARRYGLLGMAGLAPEDDDGEATKRPPAPRSEANTTLAEKPPERDPRKVADSLIAIVENCLTMDNLQTSINAPKFDAAWDWLEVEKPFMAAEVKKAVTTKQAEFDPALQGDLRKGKAA